MELPADRRQVFLAEACHGDATLVAEVSSLLAAHEEAGDFLEAPALPLAPSSAEPGQLGPYRLLREIGRGGMSTVWLAVRADDEFERKVAIKLIKPGMDTEDILRRLRMERQILAHLDHPNIARLYDGGSTAEGRPYVVMEHILGTPIDQYCESRGLAVPERLELFLQVCAAVQTAHQSLVVHRDLKPGNVLVTAEGVPKLLDFGIAKLLASEHAPEPATQTMMRLLTPQYASPEQVRGEIVTTASDVFSLGVLLFRLLTMRLPYRLTTGSPEELQRALTEQQPPRPSEVASSEGLRRKLRGDLDNIVQKAMHPDRERRYGSAEQLADDLRRHLAGRPVSAHPDSLGYRTGKLLRRHKLAVAAGVAVAALAAGFTGITAVQARHLADERDKAEQLSAVLINLLQGSDPVAAGGKDVTLREVLERDSERVLSGLAAQPEVQATLLDTIGTVYLHLGDFPQASRMLERALVLRRRELGPRHPKVAETLDHLGSLAEAKDDCRAADRLYREALALRRSALGPRHPDLATSLAHRGNALRCLDQLPLAQELLSQAVALRESLLPADHLDLAEARANLGMVLAYRGDSAGAEALFRKAYEVRRRRLGSSHAQTADSLNHLQFVLPIQGKNAEAEALLREALAIYRQELGPEHPRVSEVLGNLAALLSDSARYAEAEVAAREALALRRKVFPDATPLMVHSYYTLGRIRYHQGDNVESEELLQRALDNARKVLPAGALPIRVTQAALGEVWCRRGEHDRGEDLLRRTLELDRAAGPSYKERIAESQIALAECLMLRNERTEAKQLVLRSKELLSAASYLNPKLDALLARLR